MRVILDIEIETPDYDGADFFKEFSSLVESIRKQAGDSTEQLRIIRFKMRDKSGNFDDPRDFIFGD